MEIGTTDVDKVDVITKAQGGIKQEMNVLTWFWWSSDGQIVERLNRCRIWCAMNNSTHGNREVVMVPKLMWVAENGHMTSEELFMVSGEEILSNWKHCYVDGTKSQSRMGETICFKSCVFAEERWRTLKNVDSAKGYETNMTWGKHWNSKMVTQSLLSNAEYIGCN